MYDIKRENIKFKKISNVKKILKGITLLTVTILVIFLVVALISFHPFDPSWSQSGWNEPVKNLAGNVGAWSADILFSIFGILAYFIPLVMLLGSWIVLKDMNNNRHCLDFFILSLRLIGVVILIITSCALASLNIDDLPNFPSGGIIGSIFINAILPRFNMLEITLGLLCIWAISFTLFTGWSWLIIAEKIGVLLLSAVSLIIGHTCRNNKFQIIESYLLSHLIKFYDNTNVDYIDLNNILSALSII